MKKRKTEKMVTIALLAAFSYLLLFLEIPILPGFGWLKLDFSDIPVLIGTFIVGPVGGILIALIRSSLNVIFRGGDILNLIGNMTGFMASVIFMLPIYWMARRDSTAKGILKGSIISSIVLVLFMSIANYYVITPLYIKVLGMDFGMSTAKMVLYGVIPFNVIKGIAVSAVFYIIYKKLMPIIIKRVSFLSVKD